MNISLVKADDALFAVYQTMYSGVDTYMSYDWESRLGDTKHWADQGYFLVLDGKKIGGAIITAETIRFPFLIAPYCDRIQFWRYLLELAPRKTLEGMLDEDVSILPMFNYKVMHSDRAMCRPADVIEKTLPDEFACRPLDLDTDAEEFGKVYVESHTGGICFEINGVQTIDEGIADAKYCLGIYNSKDMSIVIIEKATDQIVAACVAGISNNHVLKFSEIGEFVVSPQYQGKGLGKYMLSHIITQTYGLSPIVKIWVDVGNISEHLYRQMGFIPGPRFTHMERRA